MGQLDFPHGYNDPDYKTDDPPTYEQACMGMLVCPHCGKAAICGDVTSLLHEQGDNMIPRGNPSTGGSGGGGRKRRGSGLRYLAAEMLTTTHQAASIVDARTQPDQFRPGTECVVVKLKFKGEYILWTLRSGNPSLETLGDALGDDETTWKGAELELYIEEDGFDGKKWIRSEVVEQPKGKKK